MVYKVVNSFGGSATVLDKNFYLNYSKGSVVKAPEKTLGIACFKSEFEAVKFQFIYGNGVIIMVEPIGEPTEREWCGSIIDIPKFYDYYLNEISIPKELVSKTPKGTVWYSAVKVLEDYKIANLHISEERKEMIKKLQRKV